MKRLIALFLMAVLALTLVSCLGGGSLKLTIRSSSISEEDLNLQKSVISEFVKAFEKKNPKIDVEIEYVKEFPVDFKNVEVALIAADSVIEYAPTDTTNLIDIIDGKDGDFLVPALNTGVFYKENEYAEYGKKQIFIPFNYDRAVVFVDKAMFEKLGLPMPGVNWTYEEFAALTQSASVMYENDDGMDELLIGTYMPISQSFVWKYFVNKAAESWYSEEGTVKFSSEEAQEGWRELNVLYRTKQANSFFANGRDSAYTKSVMSWNYAAQPTRGDNVHLPEEAFKTNPAYRADELVANDNLLLLPLPAVNGNRYSFANTDYIHGLSISSYIDKDKMDSAMKLIEFANSLEGNSILNRYYGGIPANKALWEESFWRTGVFAGENGDNALVGIENDVRDDYVDLFKGDVAVYEKNLRARCIMAYYLTQKYPSSGRSNESLIKHVKSAAREINNTINELGVPFGYNPQLIKESDE
ncbi:MAG: carbohydrate ABC transporter substrate-binding protein [Clostridia bacterium]|nr:carbohydrate ABC transporter substrate-binding protein [Clostridia bacterium]